MSNVDQLVERTPLDLVLSHYRLPLTQSNTREYRMKCVFNETCSDSQYGNMAIQLDVAKQLYCHSCKVRGNLLTLIHGLETQSPPAGGRLRGQEFKNALVKLREINGLVESSSPSGQEPAETKASESAGAALDEKHTTKEILVEVVADPSESVEANDAVQADLQINVPLVRHEKEAARELADLHKDLVTDVSQMSPAAATYLRPREHWMTSELMQKWGCGWIPGNGRSLFRKNYFVYTHRNARGEIVSYSGRDLNFESKWEKWLRAAKPEGKKPNKHRYVSGFKRGAELYGGFASRLNEPPLKESLSKHGLVVVEGMNDVIRLDELGICAVGLCSNRATEQQIDILVKYARQVANNRILLMPDCDEEGEAGFKDLLWRLAENHVEIKLGMCNGTSERQCSGLQPEDIE